MFSRVEIGKVRDYWDARPCNVKHSSAPIGSRRYFDEVEARKYFAEPHIPGFAAFGLWDERKVLEIGCGIGTDTIRFARAGAEVTAVDLSAKSLELAKRRAEVFGLADKIRFFQADAEVLSESVPPGPYDLVYSFGVVHHTPNPRRIVEQVRRHYLRGGGTLKLMVYHRYSWKVFNILISEGYGAFWKLDELVARNSEAQTGCPVTYTYSKKEVLDLLGEGFDVTEIRVEHIFPYRIPDYIQHRYVMEWYFRYMPGALFRWLERRVGWHLCVTARAR